MYCRRCGQYVSDDMMYCPRCGFEIKQSKKVCYYCKQPLTENEEYCPYCGRSQIIQEHEDPYKGYWKKPILWIILVVLLTGSFYISDYISDHPLELEAVSESNGSEQMEITGAMNIAMIAANNQGEGTVYIDSSSLYCVRDHNLYVASLDKPGEMTKLIEGCQGYLYITQGKLYFCDNYYDYYCYDLQTKDKELLLENIYYPIIADGKLYYQCDEDNESIHCLDLENKEDKKLNDTVSYDITIDNKANKLYYLALDEETYTLKRMDLDGQNDEAVYECSGSSTFVLDDDHIYMYDNDKIMKISKDSKEEKVLKENLYGGYINICQDQLVYTSDVLYKMTKDGKNETKLTDQYVEKIQIIGDYIIGECYSGYDKTINLWNIDGNNMELFGQIDDFEGLEEV